MPHRFSAQTSALLIMLWSLDNHGDVVSILSRSTQNRRDAAQGECPAAASPLGKDSAISFALHPRDYLTDKRRTGAGPTRGTVAGVMQQVVKI